MIHLHPLDIVCLPCQHERHGLRFDIITSSQRDRDDNILIGSHILSGDIILISDSFINVDKCDCVSGQLDDGPLRYIIVIIGQMVPISACIFLTDMHMAHGLAAPPIQITPPVVREFEWNGG